MSDINTINYQPLVAVQQAARTAYKQTLKGKGPLLIAVLLLPAIGGIVLWNEVGFWLIMATIGGYGVWLQILIAGYKDKAWLAFATVNGWQLNTTTPASELLSPMLTLGHDQAYSPVIAAQLGEVAANVFFYSTTVGEGKEQRTYEFTVVQTQLSKELPHMFLKAQKGAGGLRQDFTNGENLKLEGDFDNYFTLQIEKGQEVDALAVITPDIMQTLVNYSQTEDIEIYGTSLYFILHADQRKPEQMQKLVQSVVEVDKQVQEYVQQTTVPAPIVVPGVITPAVAPAAPTTPVV